MTKTILLVDDDALVLRALARSLTASGADVVQASNYADAVAALARYEACGLYAVVTDYDLGTPGATGLDLLRKAPIGAVRVLMSGAMPPAAYGAPWEDHLLFKPFPPSFLSKLLGLGADAEEVPE